MARLTLRNLNSDEPAGKFVLSDTDDDHLAAILIVIDEDLASRGGVWLRMRVVPDGANTVTWIPATALVAHAEFDGDTPPAVIELTAQRAPREGGNVVDLRLYTND